jgi:hypothetical protein
MGNCEVFTTDIRRVWLARDLSSRTCYRSLKSVHCIGGGAATSPHWADETSEAIAMNFVSYQVLGWSSLVPNFISIGQGFSVG